MGNEGIINIFAEREKQIMGEVALLAKNVAKQEMSLFEFELFDEVMVPQEVKDKAEKSVQRVRKEGWRKALDKAEGNKYNAFLIYSEDA